MKKFIKLFILSICAVFLISDNAMAINFGQNITIWDGIDPGSSTNINEDNETEPGTIQGQEWDLEAFFLEDVYSLSMVGGFDYKTGVYGSGSWWEPGDIFIDVNGDAVFGADTPGSGGNQIKPNIYGYDYVLVMDYDNEKYSVVSIDENSFIRTAYYNQFDHSNPWVYYSDGSTADLEDYQNLDMGYYVGTDVDGVTLWDGEGTHYAVTVDLSFLGSYSDTVYFHSTMQCGNDNLMGAVPEPATMLLLGTGLIGIAGIGRRKFAK